MCKHDFTVEICFIKKCNNFNVMYGVRRAGEYLRCMRMPPSTGVHERTMQTYHTTSSLQALHVMSGAVVIEVICPCRIRKNLMRECHHFLQTRVKA